VNTSEERHQVMMDIKLTEDVVQARLQGRELARELGFSGSQSMLVVTAISELARNILRHAGAGEIGLSVVTQGAQSGLRIIALDRGPGINQVTSIPDTPHAVSNNAQLGLVGLREIVDELELGNRPGGGACVAATIWL
jgi:serine/threonine-protein kinase RsbT